jgi:two-component system, sensor histidine kinase
VKGASAPERVLMLAPTRGDAEVCRRFLAAGGFSGEVYTDAAAFCAALREPAAVLLVAEESLAGPAGHGIRDHVAEQPEWSAVPIIVFGGRHATHRLGALDRYDAYGRVTLLERPVRMATFIGTLRLALEERRQQYRIRDLLAERAERIEQRDEFMAMLGHELRNPLAALMVTADVLANLPVDSDQAARCLGMIGTQARQIKRLLDDLADVSRINRRKLALEREPTDLRQVLHDAVAQVQDEIGRRNQCLDLDLDGPPAPLLADPLRLRQVFANLLTNATRYTPEGGEIRVSMSAGQGLVHVAIQDNGAGVRAEALERIFEPFYQERDEHGRHAGLGIGLTLARTLVEMHAGTISARSDGPGRGTEFVVTLPLSTAGVPRAEAPAAPSGAVAAPPGRHILVIEDNHELADGMRYLLEARGHSVAVAHDGPAGLRAALQRRPDAVVLDIGLPGLDGCETARRLRRIDGLSGVRIIAVTGFGRAADRERSRRAGIDRHLVKPVSLAELEGALAG